MTVRKVLLALSLSVFALAATAQTSVPRIRTIEPTPAATPSADVTVVDKDAQIQRLRENNQRLRAENNQLKARIDAMTTRGGSAVTAYCENPQESRNTAGGVDACGDYTCNDASGLCRDRCTTSLHCGPGTACDIPSGTCQRPPQG
jgi:uncharacterized protein YlxW (UPF0749 family)